MGYLMSGAATLGAFAEEYISEEDDAPPGVNGLGDCGCGGGCGTGRGGGRDKGGGCGSGGRCGGKGGCGCRPSAPLSGRLSEAPACPRAEPSTCPRRPPLTASTCVTRSEHRGLGFLAGLNHRGRPADPDLIVRVNRTAPVMDLVLHFHGFSGCGRNMRLERDKEPASGLDFCNPDSPQELGRTRPTVALLPRGRFNPEVRYDAYGFGPLFHEPPEQRRARARTPGSPLVLPLTELMAFGMRQAASGAGLPAVRRGRFIVTGHSGGGAPARRLLATLSQDPPEEVHIFDGLYGDLGAPIQRWLEARLGCDALALRHGISGVAWPSGRCAAQRACFDSVTPFDADRYMRSCGGAMRVLYGSSTSTASERLRDFLTGLLRRYADVAAILCRYYRVERTTVPHNAIPRFYGYRLLADAGANVPCARVMSCVSRAVRAPRVST